MNVSRMVCKVSSYMLIAVPVLGAGAQQVQKAYLDSSLPIAQRVDSLVSQMTLEEKVSQMQNHAAAIPRLDVPEYDWWSEGLHGAARSGYSTVFPQAIGLAATWDTDLMHQVATVISTEARAKYNQAIRDNNHSIYYGLTFWSPNINIFRDPRWGRGQETYGEDPYLTGRMGVAFVEGMQGDNPDAPRVVATPKHYAVHSGPESDRHKFNVEVAPYDLEDTYLPAFRATVTEGRAGSVMCAYNAIDGAPACANKMLLTDILREKWHFHGYVTSDCGAVGDIFEGHKYAPDLEHASVAAVRAGTDTSCGTEYSTLTKAVHDRLIGEEEIDTVVKRLFTARFELGMFDPPSKSQYAQLPFSEVDSEAHRQLALATARKAIVLLKNENHALPLKNVRTVAVIGPNATTLSALEGNYNAIPSQPVRPLDGLIEKLKGRGKVLYSEGSPHVEAIALPVPRTVFHPSLRAKEDGLTAEYFDNTDFSGKPVLTRVDREIDFDWNAAAPVKGVKMQAFSVRWQGTITPPAAGEYTFRIQLSDCYPCNDREQYNLYIDGKFASGGSTGEEAFRSKDMETFKTFFADTRAHQFRLEYTHRSQLFGAGITFSWIAPADALRREAVEIAKKSDVVVAFVGLTPFLEGEEMPVHVKGFSGGDRTSLDLPDAQQQMLEAVAATGKPLVVVLMNGSALAVNWAQQHAAAILEAWYPGEEGGTAIAETLLGENNPAGRLPVTFYASTDQLPPFDDYSMKNRTYRYFHGRPLYGFGYGLSYSTFTYSGLKLSTDHLQAGDTLHAEVDVRNISAVDGDEVVELYLTPPQSSLAPIEALEGFERVHLKSGETRHVSFALDPRRLSLVGADGKRSVMPGQYAIHVGGGLPAPGEGAEARVEISGTQSLPE
jgi:beta-glucosidase